MTKMFREAFLEALESTNATIAEIARVTGVSKDQMHKIKQGSSKSTNVDDARKIAKYFNKSLDEFLDDQESLVRSEITHLWSQLSEAERDFLLKAARGVADPGPAS